jgi:hypothetical protein
MFTIRRVLQKQTQGISMLHKINSLNECEKPFIKTHSYRKPFENPLNECEKPLIKNNIISNINRINQKKFKNSWNECEKPFK